MCRALIRLRESYAPPYSLPTFATISCHVSTDPHVPSLTEGDRLAACVAQLSPARIRMGCSKIRMHAWRAAARPLRTDADEHRERHCPCIPHVCSRRHGTPPRAHAVQLRPRGDQCESVCRLMRGGGGMVPAFRLAVPPPACGVCALGCVRAGRGGGARPARGAFTLGQNTEDLSCHS